MGDFFIEIENRRFIRKWTMIGRDFLVKNIDNFSKHNAEIFPKISRKFLTVTEITQNISLT